MRAKPAAPPRRGRRVRRTLLAIALVLVVLIGGTVAWSYSKFKSIETVDLTTLSSENGTNYLIVGSDSRDGVDPNSPNAGAILGDDTTGGAQRSDTIMILRIDDQGTRTLSIPRDLLVTIAETGDVQRINAAFNGGPDRLIATLTDQLGIPIQHYLEINFVSFADMVDALGGITIDFAYPALDTHSGLLVPNAGPQKLDGVQALAYVRSRYYTEIINGERVMQGNGDIGRVVRQQQFLAALSGAIGSSKNPLTLSNTASAMAGGMRIDSDLGYFTALNLVRKMRSLNPEPNALPTSNGRRNGADILNLVQPGADEVLATFGSPGASIDD